MSKYELDLSDEQAEALAVAATNEGWTTVSRALRQQIPVPVSMPTKAGAMVRAGANGEPYLLADLHAEDGLSWIEVGSGDWKTDEQIGRITEVLAEGVDL